MVDRLTNTYQFYALFKDAAPHVPADTSEHVLDRWVVSLMRKAHGEVTDAMEHYELDKASRVLIEVVDDLSTWYLRRSRDRVKSNHEADVSAALSTLAWLLREYAKLSAPVMPFLSEWLWQSMKREGDAESVHLTSWSARMEHDEDILVDMAVAREMVSRVLELRMQSGVKVRQPLSKLTHPFNFSPELAAIVAEEVNVKELVKGDKLELDIALTPELLQEGQVRELVREVQALRKTMNLTPGQKVSLTAHAHDEAASQLLTVAQEELMRVANVEKVLPGEVPAEATTGVLRAEGAAVLTFTLTVV